MAYSNEAKKVFTSQVAFKGGVQARTLAGNLTLDATSANFLRLDPGGSNRNVTLPDAAANPGLFFCIANGADAAENLVLKDGSDTVVTVGQAEFGIVGSDGTDWLDLGFGAVDVSAEGLTLLASTSNGEGASLIGIQDSASLLTATNVEAALLELVKYVPVNLADPGTAQAIPVTRSAQVPLVFNGSETNTLAVPGFKGQTMLLYAKTATSGSRVVTVAAAVNQTGNNTLTFAQARDCIKLEAIELSAGTLAWQVVYNDGVALSTV